ncbi:hypothetical protein CBA19CS11_32250 [Caballeronia novacaledonica]|uniref:hypothetical protein n=1 Tax=Caballeronia novacaledonica TaxID=1544861 RepID=UPI001EE28EAB|nr:hypothetical protein [Caballeronia novacaledonica]GJH13610.1 hypothetical protein CBA19CS11_32250 [Caballeronia novacaledonica]
MIATIMDQLRTVLSSDSHVKWIIDPGMPLPGLCATAGPIIILQDGTKSTCASLDAQVSL